MLSHAFSKGQYFSGLCSVILSYLVISLPHMGRFFFSFNPHPDGNFTSVTSFPRHLKLPMYLLGISIVFYRIFIVVCSVTWPMNGSEAGGDLFVMLIKLF